MLLLATLALRGASGNRHVRGRLLASSAAFAVYVAVAAALVYAPLSPEITRRLRELQPLLAAFGLLNAIVAVAINPWRASRLPDRFPTIVQDTIVIMLFAVAATFLLQERIFATTAVGAVVIGFALQDTLGNLFAGLAIQVEKPFRVGHWVNLAGKDGIVAEITWRATKIRTKAGNFLIVPNNVLARDTITNYSEPTLDTRIEVLVGAAYDTPPNQVKAVILRALADEPLLVRGRESEVLIADFGASAVMYRIRAWTSDFAADERVADRIRSTVYYAFGRHGISIPYPVQVQLDRQDVVAPASDPAQVAGALARVEIFQPLTDEQRAELARVARPGLYAAGELVVREGDAGASMFIVVRGEVVVTLTSAAGEVARLGPGAFFGEMSLLTGEPRTANVAARSDCDLVEITVDDMRRLVFADPSIVERVGMAVATRREALERHRATGAGPAPEPPQSFVARAWRFFRLSAPTAEL